MGVENLKFVIATGDLGPPHHQFYHTSTSSTPLACLVDESAVFSWAR